ncbi:MAG: DNA polymerase III subunit alpha [Candidatus Pacebacteria bacterium]|nr:DNA polymerase III subunit alpha [Candidatus Paceibacterota bacterium]
MSKFTHLHVHSEYSLLDGLSKINLLVDKAVEYGMNSLALTDHGVMYGAVKFYLACKEAGVNPIIGFEAYVAARSRFDKQARVDSDQYHLVLLAKNEAGYKNLMRLTTLAHLEGFYYKPRVDFELLEKYHEGLIALSACLKGQIPSLLLQGQKKQAIEKAQKLVEIFGKDFYLELQHHPQIPAQEKANQALIKLSRELGIPLVATNDVHYVNADDAEAQDALLAVGTQKMIADQNRLTMLDSPDFYLRSQEEMIKLFSRVPDAIKNTQKIARACSLEIPIGQWILPAYPLAENETAEEHLRKMAFERIKTRFKKVTSEIKERLNYELGIISNKGFATYFLIVQDFVNWAKREKIRVGPGRGSVAGSLVSYALRITSVDPLKHNIPFERFMNPERPSPPDIDLDFADDRRDEVIGYVTQKYGRDKVAQIITFGTMEARQAIRDIGRVMGMPYSDPDQIAKLIPSKTTIAEAIKTIPELERFYAQEKYRKLLDLAQRVEGISRHASVHAAGVVVADKPLTEYCPLQKEAKGEKIVTQYDMYVLDLNVTDKAIGLLKIDFLGLRNLTILERAREYIKAVRGEEIDISEIPLDDRATFEKVIIPGETTGVFQLESAGMRRVARKLKPNLFSDIAAMVALYRPGPMQFIDEFIAGKNNPALVKYPHPDLKPVLAETYGIAVYQEQCLQIANVMGKYSLGEADILRRAIGKKKISIMNKEKIKFVRQAQEAGYKKEVAENVWGLIERFAGYGFNKAHSTCYAMIAYQTAYLKAHYPIEFMAALLTVESSSSSGPAKDEKLTQAVVECRRLGILVLPPDINASKTDFTVEEEPRSFENRAIRFGLGAIKNVGEAAIGAILKAREMGNFQSLTDFCQRVDAQKVNKKVLESLIKVGAMDSFGKRAPMLSVLEQIRSRGATIQKQRRNGQGSFFDQRQSADSGLKIEDNLPEIQEFPRSELLSLERNLLGFYLTEHPLSSALSLLDRHRTHKLFEITQQDEVGQRVKVGGMISDVRIVVTRKTSEEMAFIKLEDDTASLEAVVFPKTFASTRDYWTKEKIVLLEGKVESREDAISLIVDSASLLSETDSDQLVEKFDFEIRLPASVSPKKLVVLNDLLKNNRGSKKAVLIFADGSGSVRRMPLPYRIDYSQELASRIKQIIGD